MVVDEHAHVRSVPPDGAALQLGGPVLELDADDDVDLLIRWLVVEAAGV